MAREIDVSKASTWNAQEKADNAQYLRQRGRDAEADQIDGGAPSEAQDPSAVPEGTVAEVLDWVGDDEARALQALSAEQAKGDDARKGVVEELEAFLP